MTTRGRLTAAFAVTLGFAILYWQVLVKLVLDWYHDDNYSHGFLIVPIAAYFAWERRARLKAAAQNPSVLGLVVVLGSIAVLLAGILGSELFLTRLSIVGVVAGAVLFMFGTPEWKPIATGYLGLLLMGGSFLSLGLFISSLTRNQIVAGMVTFAVFLLLWVITWIGSAAGPTAEKITQYLSIVDHYDDFGKGVLDTTHFIYYVSFITFGLFLTAKSVDSERWRG